MWAIYERVGHPAVSPHIQALDHSPIDATDHELNQALDLLGLEWADA